MNMNLIGSWDEFPGLMQAVLRELPHPISVTVKLPHVKDVSPLVMDWPPDPVRCDHLTVTVVLRIPLPLDNKQ